MSLILLTSDFPLDSFFGGFGVGDFECRSVTGVGLGWTGDGDCAGAGDCALTFAFALAAFEVEGFHQREAIATEARTRISRETNMAAMRVRYDIIPASGLRKGMSTRGNCG